MSMLNGIDNGFGRHSLFAFVIGVLNKPVRDNIKLSKMI